MIRPALPATAFGDQPRQLSRRSLTQGDEIRRLVPSGRFLGAARCDHLTDHRRQHGGRMLPADQIEALEGLVDEVERMSGVREHPIGPGCEHKLGERGRRGAGCYRGEHSAFRRLPMPDGCPAPQPPLERREIR